MRTVIVSIASPRQAVPAVNAVVLAAIGHTCSFMSALNAFASRTAPIPATPADRDPQIFVNDHAVDLKPPEPRQSRCTYEFPTGPNVLRGVVDTHLSEADKDLLENTFHRSKNVRPPMVLVAA
jgi:hypothetical protein